MASYENLTSKHQKFQNEDSDMFSDLPKHLVSHILSHLPTKEAIKTSILSKRWRFLWTTISNLDFSDDKIYDPRFYDVDGNLIDKVNNDVRIKYFTDYVNRVLFRLEPTSIDKFSIFLDIYPDRLHFKKWISAAVKCNVRDLELSPESFVDNRHNPIDVPRQVFHCKSLEALTLNQGVFFNIPKQGFVCFPNLKFLCLESVNIRGIPAKENSVCFPKLKTLHLRNVSFVGKDDCVMKLMHNCPVLEDLLIGKVIKNNVSNVDMCIPLLRTAELYFSSYNSVVEIEAPIKYLKIIDRFPIHKILVKNPDSLIEADLRMVNFITYDEEERGLYDFQGEQREEVFKLIKTVDKVQCLALLFDTVAIIKASNIKLPLFCNLIRLEVELNCKDLCVLQCLLNNSNNLQILFIKKKHPPCPKGDGRWTELSHVPKCLLTSLKRVEILNSNGCTYELDMIKNMLKCAKILKRLTTTFLRWYDGDINSVRQKISTFPRASAACEVDFL